MKKLSEMDFYDLLHVVRFGDPDKPGDDRRTDAWDEIFRRYAQMGSRAKNVLNGGVKGSNDRAKFAEGFENLCAGRNGNEE